MIDLLDSAANGSFGLVSVVAGDDGNAVAHVPLYDAGAIQQTVVVAPPDEATPNPVAGTGVTTGGGDHGLGVPSYFDGNTNVSPYTSDDEGTLIAASALRRGVRCGCCGLECCGLEC